MLAMLVLVVGGRPQSLFTGFLSVLAAWRLASPRATGPRGGEPGRGCPSQHVLWVRSEIP